MLTNRKYTLLAVLLTFVFHLGSTGQEVGCGDQWFDTGGETGIYSANELTTTTFCPDVLGEIVTLSFNYVDIETTAGTGIQAGCWDFIEIFDGPDANSPSLGVFCGEESGDGGVPSVPASLLSVGDAFTATNVEGCLTVVFDSDGSIQETGWEALVSCGPPPNCVSPEISVATERSCDDFNFDAVVTIDAASPGGAPLLVITATLNDVQLAGGTVPNLDGQTVELNDLPLDAGVLISVDVLGASCTATEVANISSIGCPVPLTCGEGLEVSYCYTDNDNNIFLYESPVDEPVVIFFQSGLIETFGDIISIYDGIDATGALLFSGNNGGDFTGLAATANSGSLFLAVASSGFGSCTSGSPAASEWNWIVGCGDFDIPGCIDPAANNFLAEATIDDGSCIFPEALICGEATEVSYCYDNNETSFFSYASPDGEEVSIFFTEGLIESCCDDIFIYDGLNSNAPLLFGGNNGGNLATLSFLATSGTIYMELDTDGSVSCTSGSTNASEWTWIVGCGEIDIPGCTDLEALNFSPAATVDDGSCIFPAINDEACGAEVLECNGASLTGNFDAASISTELINCGLESSPGDLWFQFEANGSSTYLISAENGPDMVVALYSGDDCGNLVEVEGCSDFPESFTGAYEAGTYYFIVRPWSSSTFNNSYDVSLTCVDGAPDNDEPCGAVALECNGEALNGTFLGATSTIDDACFGTGTGDVWYSFVADGATAYSIEETSFSNVVVGLYTASECDGELTEVLACQDFPESFNGVYDAGNYFVRIRPANSEQVFTIELNCATPPENDLICNAEPISCDADAVGTTLGSTFDNVGFCGTVNTAPGVWYEFTPDFDGITSFSTCDQADFDTKISVFTAADCEDNLVCVAGLDDSFPCTGNSTLLADVDVFAGQTYFVLVHGFGTGQGIFTLSVACEEVILDCPGIGNIGDACNDGDPATINDVVTEDCDCLGTPPPPGQVCGIAIDVTGLPYQDIDNTVNFGDDYEATDLPPLSPDAISNGFSTFYFGGDDVVYAYTPTEDQFIDVTLSNHDAWTGLFVIEGCPFESTIGSHTDADNLGREIEGLPVTAGTTYYVVISTFPAPQSTAYQLNINIAGFDCPELEADFGDTCDDGDENTINDSITADCECVGTPTPTSQCGEYTSAPDLAFGTNQAIITDDIEVSGTSGTLTDLNVVLVIDHIWTADVEARLTSPSGAQVDLVIAECFDGDNINVLMDDDGPALSCETGSIPVLFGTFAPEGSLADFNGEDFNGTWTLEVEDIFATEDDGTLVSWCLIPTLEVTVNEECENAMVIGATPEFAGSETPASMANAVASGDAQCINAESPQADMWFAFESVTTNMYVRAWGLNDFDAAVEVFDSCGGELLNCQNDEPAGEREIVIVTNTTVGETYYFRVYHAGDAAPVEQNYTVAVAHIPFTQLSADDCGVLDYTPADMITTDLPVNQFLLTNWYFEFTELEAPFTTYEILSPNGANPNFLLEWFNEAEYGRTYEVRTRARMYQGPQWGDYGDACTIGFSSVPLTTQLIEEQALGFYDMCDVLEADNVPGAEGYRWKFYTGFSSAPIIYDSPTRFCQLDLAEGLSLGSPYGVAIRAFTQGVLAPTGEIKLIAMNNFVPDTELDGAITDCGATYELNTVVSAVNICAAEFYTFKFTNVTDANQADLFYTRDDGLRSINLTSVIGLIAGDTYAVQVLGGSGGLVGEYGDACEITIAGGNDGLVELNEGSTDQLSDVAIELYPNPTSGEEVMMNLSNLSQEQQEVMVEVYDLYGKKVHAEILGNNGSQMNAVIRLPELASGIYTVNVVVNEERVGAKKLVVR